jgi:hypothetical protein
VTSAAIDVKEENIIQLRVVIDRSVIEAFLNEGRRAITRRVYPANPLTSMNVQLYTICALSETCHSPYINITTVGLRDANITDYLDGSDVIPVDDEDKNSNDIFSFKWVVVSVVCGVFGVLLLVGISIYGMNRKRLNENQNDINQNLL